MQGIGWSVRNLVFALVTFSVGVGLATLVGGQNESFSTSLLHPVQSLPQSVKRCVVADPAPLEFHADRLAGLNKQIIETERRLAQLLERPADSDAEILLNLERIGNLRIELHKLTAARDGMLRSLNGARTDDLVYREVCYES